MDTAIDPRALWNISYGLYIVTSAAGGKMNGQIVNAVVQVSGQPARVAVSINKLNLTHDYILQSGVMALSTLEEQTPMDRIGLFGFRSGRDVDKMSQTAYVLGSTGCPLVTESVLSAMEGRVVASADGGTHTVFVVELTRADVLKEGRPLTYAYYQTVRGGRASRNAPTYKGEEDVPAIPAAGGRFRCSLCGYRYDPAEGDPAAGVPPGTRFEDLPADWVCPVCGAGKEEFSAAE